MHAYLFPGQGSQFKGMGAGLFREFREYVEEASNILAYNISDLCLNDVHGVLGKTQYTQPALFVVNALSYLRKLKKTGEKPDYVAGHSLGEYNALYVAGVFDFATGVKLTKRRGEIMAKAKGGAMAAVVGLDEKRIRTILTEKNLDSIDIANLNSPNQIVLSGLKKDILEARSVFEKAGALHYAVLNVSSAFHSRYMESSRQEFNTYLDEIHFSPPTIPVISNVYAQHYKYHQVKETLSKQIVSPVRWTESICYLMGKNNIILEQLGPGNEITSLVKQIRVFSYPENISRG